VVKRQNVHVTKDEWLKLLSNIYDFRTVTDESSFAECILGRPWDKPLAERYPGWTRDRLLTAATVYARAITAAGSAGVLDSQLRVRYDDWDDSAVDLIAHRAIWPEEMDPAEVERLATDTRPMLVTAWDVIRTRIFVFGNPFIGAQASFTGEGWPVDYDEAEFIIEAFAEEGFTVQKIQSQGGAPTWEIVVFWWIASEAGHLAFDDALEHVAKRFWKYCKSKGRKPPERFNLYVQSSPRTPASSHEVSDPDVTHQPGESGEPPEPV
jgi:hypothetical protein